MIHATERLRCPYCGGIVGFLAGLAVPDGWSLVATYSTMKGTNTVQVKADVCRIDGDGSEDKSVVERYHACPMLTLS